MAAGVMLNKNKNPEKRELAILVQRKYLIRIKKSPFSQLRKIKARLTLLSTSHREFQRRKDKTESKDQETKYLS
jgi:hypothetical protein